MLGVHDVPALRPCSHPTSYPCRYKHARDCASYTVTHGCARRVALLAPLSFLTASPSFAATAVAQDVLKDLQADFIPAPGTSWALLNRTREVIYPEAFEGEWAVAATLQDVKFPLGMDLITKETPGATKSSMIAALPDVGAGMDGAVQYSARFDAVLGGAVPDRMFNQTSLLNAFLGYAATQQVDYDRNKNPQRMAVVYKTPRRDQSQQSNDIRKAELFFNSNRYDATQAGRFYMTEAIRQVNQARQSGFVYDYEILQGFSGVGGKSMTADMRVAAFIVPEAAGFFKSKGAAVAMYDYKLVYSRVD